MYFLNLSAMQTYELKTDIASLEYQFDHYNDLLDKAISKNVKINIKKILYQRLKEISDRLNKIRGLWEVRWTFSWYQIGN